jgi:hypothetical protein
MKIKKRLNKTRRSKTRRSYRRSKTRRSYRRSKTRRSKTRRSYRKSNKTRKHKTGGFFKTLKKTTFNTNLNPASNIVEGWIWMRIKPHDATPDISDRFRKKWSQKYVIMTKTDNPGLSIHIYDTDPTKSGFISRNEYKLSKPQMKTDFSSNNTAQPQISFSNKKILIYRFQIHDDNITLEFGLDAGGAYFDPLKKWIEGETPSEDIPNPMQNPTSVEASESTPPITPTASKRRAHFKELGFTVDSDSDDDGEAEHKETPLETPAGGYWGKGEIAASTIITTAKKVFNRQTTRTPIPIEELNAPLILYIYCKFKPNNFDIYISIKHIRNISCNNIHYNMSLSEIIPDLQSGECNKGYEIPSEDTAPNMNDILSHHYKKWGVSQTIYKITIETFKYNTNNTIDIQFNITINIPFPITISSPLITLNKSPGEDIIEYLSPLIT